MWPLPTSSLSHTSLLTTWKGSRRTEERSCPFLGEGVEHWQCKWATRIPSWISALNKACCLLPTGPMRYPGSRYLLWCHSHHCRYPAWCAQAVCTLHARKRSLHVTKTQRLLTYSHEGSTACISREGLRVDETTTDSKITEFNIPFSIQQHVGWFHICIGSGRGRGWVKKIEKFIKGMNEEIHMYMNWCGQLFCSFVFVQT